MQRNTRKVEKRTYTLKNVLPRFVSIVSRGANLTPLAELRYSEENAKFSEVEINRIEFSKTNFNREQVAQYMDENDYSDYEIEEGEESFMVRGVDAEAFEDIAPIEAADGVMFFVGKLAKENEVVQASAEVAKAEVLEFQEPTADKAESENEEDEKADDEGEADEDSDEADEEGEQDEGEVEAIAASDPASVDTEDTQEVETDTTEQEVAQASEPDAVETEVEETQSVFNEPVFRERAEAALAAFFDALEQAKTEAFAAPVEETTEETQGELFSQEQVDAMIAAAIEEFKQESAEFNDKGIDTEVILVQNRQSSEQDEINSRSVSRNPETEKFSQRKTNDLFGLK